MITKLLKKLKCEHEYKHYRNIYGDEINTYFPIRRSEWECVNCGKRELRGELYRGGEDT